MVEAEPVRPRPVGPPDRCAQVTPCSQGGAAGTSGSWLAQPGAGRVERDEQNALSLSLLISQIVVRCTCKNVHVLTDSCAAHVMQWSLAELCARRADRKTPIAWYE